MKKLLIAALVVAFIGGVYLWSQTHGQNRNLTGIAAVNGRLELERLDIASLYAGRVEEIYVKEGQNVEKNQPLARLSSSQTQSQVDSARAQIEAAKAQKQRALEGVVRANSEILEKQQQLKVAKLEMDNAKKLRAEKLISASELERRQANYRATQASLERSKAAKAEAEAVVAQSTANISKAEALSHQATSQNEDMLIKAPIAGRVEYKIAEVGNVLGVGGRVVSLLDTTDVYINLFLPSYQSNLLKLGDEARIKIDGSDYVFPATISYVAGEAQFTPKSVETAEERAKLMFKVKLQVPAEVAKQYSGLLKGGMTAMGYVKYDTDAVWSENLNINLPQGEE
ncbi:HlyD family secretion protein [Bibersteinia trehalosi]|uniref:HlyD family secretion protein n=1 Tax=Bibersteinia trehalosi TaxID=47735 RepID=UPI004045B01B